jgi:F-type H+-transporting ATPase subunit c
MRTFKILMFLSVFMLIAASPVFAQGSGQAAGELSKAGTVIGMGIAAGLCGIGQGRAAASAAEAVARNPGARATIQTLMILGLAFIESLAIYTLVIAFIGK